MDNKGGYKGNKAQGNKGGFNKGIHLNTEEENKPRTRIERIEDDDGFIEEKKYKRVQDGFGNEVEIEIKSGPKQEVKEVKKKSC